MFIQDALDEIDYDIKIDSSIYYNTDGTLVPRVTDILSKTIHSDILCYWANSLGFKRIKYKDELQKAANIGTVAHAAIEKFFKTGIITNDNMPFLSFYKWYTELHEFHSIEIIGSEEKLVCKYFGGTYDALLKIDGKIYLIDFKTSNHITEKYFMQLAAYRHMLFICKNINIDGCIILQLDKHDIYYNEYTLDFTNLEHYQFIESCFTAFLSLVYAYYNTRHVEELYDQLF